MVQTRTHVPGYRIMSCQIDASMPTLSAAEGGCQAEIGVASSMAAALIATAYDEQSRRSVDECNGDVSTTMPAIPLSELSLVEEMN
jgi:Serine dehydratase alpha chain